MNFVFDNYYKIKSILGLSLSLAKTNFKLRNEGSYLGIFWYLLEPLSFFVILLFIKEVISQDIKDYPLYLLIGLITFNFFKSVTTLATGVIKNNSSFIKSLKMNREVFVISGILQFSFSHFFELLILASFMFFYRVNFLWLLFYPFIFFFLFLFTIGISFILAIVGVYINDLKNIWSVFMRLFWFCTPIFYSLENIKIIKQIGFFNPLNYFIDISRSIILLHKIPDIKKILIIIFFSAFSFLLGLLFFEKNKDKIAEKV